MDKNRYESEESIIKMLEQGGLFPVLLDIAPVGVVISDAEEKSLYVNKMFTRLFGYTIDDVPSVYEWWQLAYPDPENRKKAKKAWEAQIESARENRGEINPMQQTVTCKDTSTRIIEFHLASTGLLNIIIFVDITGQKEVELELKQKEERLELALAAANDGLWDWNLTRGTVYFDDTYYTMAGYEPGEFPSEYNEWFNRIHPEDREYCAREIDAHIGGKKTDFDLEYRFLNKDGGWMWIRGRGKIMVRDELGLAQRIIGTHSDINKRKRAELALQRQLGFERMIADISSYFLGLDYGQIDRGINFALQQIGCFFDVDRGYLIEIDHEWDTFSNTYEWCGAGIEPQIENLQDLPLHTIPWLFERIGLMEHIVVIDVSELPPEAAAEKEHLDEQGILSLLAIPIYINERLFGLYGFDSVREKRVWFEDEIILLKLVAGQISSALMKEQADRTIRHLSFHDHLTGLYNRHYLEEEMDRLNKGRQFPVSIIMADLNGLKLVNDTYGHARGDKLLIAAAATLTEVCREEDIVARWGGDEFVILLPRTKAEDAYLIAARITAACNDVNVDDLPLSLALGLSCKESGSDDKTMYDLLREAEDLMYKHKLTDSRSVKNAVLQALLKTLAEKSFETEAHTVRMQKIARQIGTCLNLSDTELSLLNLVITLHDIGKINVAEEILVKEGALNEQEWEIIKTHPEIGFRVTRATEDFSHVAEEVLCHHEHWNGEGYPKGLAGDKIPLLARIAALADAYEVMSNGRPYKAAMSREDIIDELSRCSGRQFDPELVKILIGILKEGDS